MKELIKRPLKIRLQFARSNPSGTEMNDGDKPINGETVALRTTSESMQVTVTEVLETDSFRVRIDDFESSVESESDGYRKGAVLDVGIDFLWPLTSGGYLVKP